MTWIDTLIVIITVTAVELKEDVGSTCGNTGSVACAVNTEAILIGIGIELCVERKIIINPYLDSELVEQVRPPATAQP